MLVQLKPDPLGGRSRSGHVDESEFRKSPLFEKLLADADNLEDDVQAFNREYANFLSRESEPISRILRLHLIVEHYLLAYLRAANPALGEPERARLSFAQKLSLADNGESTIHLLVPGIACLNTLRNRLAHSLHFSLSDFDLSPIESFISVWYGAARKPIPIGIDSVEAFSLLASSWLFAHRRMMERHAEGRGLVGLLEWYKARPRHH
ncbi:MAG: hypothetical protein ACRDKE_06120 [Solirubrobacterales bacterium]